MDVKRSRRDFLRSAGLISVAGLFAASPSPGVAADRQSEGKRKTRLILLGTIGGPLPRATRRYSPAVSTSKFSTPIENS